MYGTLANREWAILIPAWITMAVVFVYIFYAAFNMHDTPPRSSLAHIADTYGHIHPLPSPKDGLLHPIIENSQAHLAADGIPALYDLPIALVNAVLFGSDEKQES